MVDVGKHDRPLLGGDAAREAAADRDADALFDFFFDADRGACNELVGLGVQQQDRARVDLEDRLHPVEERCEQGVEVEMGESRVRERLKVAKQERAAGLVQRFLHRGRPLFPETARARRPETRGLGKDE